MTQEEKFLLLKDLCARLPYRVIVQWNKCDNPWIPDGEFKAEDFNRLASPFYEIKPYLRPMSSMTEEEKIELSCLFGGIPDEDYIYKPYTDISYSMFGEVNDWLNAHHFNYRGLIDKGLALEAPKDMYNLKEK